MLRKDVLLQLMGGIALAAIPCRASAAETGLILPSSARQGDVLRGRIRHGVMVRVDNDKPVLPDASGDFVIGVRRDAAATLKVSLLDRSGAAIEERLLAVSQRAYKSVSISGTQRSGDDASVTAAPDSAFGAYFGEDMFDGGDAEAGIDGRAADTSTSPQKKALQARISNEAAVKRGAFASQSDNNGYLTPFRWPVHGRITSEWGAVRAITTKGGEARPPKPHYGIDLRASYGTPILAPAGGEVVLAQTDYYYEGGVVFINHGQELISCYLHMSQLSCKAGDQIQQGQEIGRVGDKGRATGPHLCWRMKCHGVDVDPSSLVLEDL